VARPKRIPPGGGGIQLTRMHHDKAQEHLRFVVVHSSQLAQQQAQSNAAARAKEAEALVDRVRQVQARWFACEADAAAAIAEYEHRGPGRRGRRPQAWRYHTVH
jgi:transposase